MFLIPEVTFNPPKHFKMEVKYMKYHIFEPAE